MKHIGTTLSMLVLTGSLAGSAMAADNDAPVRAATGENYCNMRFPAMTQKSLASNHPQLKNAQTGDMIDSSPAVAGGTAYVVAGNGELVAVDMASGKLRSS